MHMCLNNNGADQSAATRVANDCCRVNTPVLFFINKSKRVLQYTWSEDPKTCKKVCKIIIWKAQGVPQ